MANSAVGIEWSEDETDKANSNENLAHKAIWLTAWRPAAEQSLVIN